MSINARPPMCVLPFEGRTPEENRAGKLLSDHRRRTYYCRHFHVPYIVLLYYIGKGIPPPVPWRNQIAPIDKKGGKIAQAGKKYIHREEKRREEHRKRLEKKGNESEEAGPSITRPCLTVLPALP